MVKITIKYDRKDFFGSRTYTEDTAEPQDTETAVKMANKAFKLVFTDNAAIQVEDSDGESIIVMQDYSDRAKDLTTVHIYHRPNTCDILNVSTTKAHALVRAMCKGAYIGQEA